MPAAFSPSLTRLDASEPNSRSAVCAKWLVDPANPLTARVAVNRLWAQLFGTGLVETEEDFGTQGELPSHPELLDWLATEYVRRGWDTKAMLRLIVTSATYRQSSRVTPERLAKDPRNRLLSRGPRFRLEAEAVRDQALALSGLLSRKIGGPVGLPGAAGRACGRPRSTASGPTRRARAPTAIAAGLYTFWRRTVPYPSMATFDAPSRETCTVRRIRTNTPLQALVTLNDPVYVEAAQALARRIVREGGATAEERAEFGLRLCLAGRRGRSRCSELVKLFADELERYRGDPAAAKKMAGVPPDGRGRARGVDGGRERAAEPGRRADEGLTRWTCITRPPASAPAGSSSRPGRSASGRSRWRRCPGRAGSVSDRRIRVDEPPVAHAPGSPLAPKPPQFAAKAKRVIYLHMSGAPPQQELFDYKPKLVELHMKPCPDELLAGQRFPFIKGHPKLLGSSVQVRPPRQERGLGQRTAAALRQARRRGRVHQVDVDRPVQPRPGRAVPLHRLGAQRRGGDGLVDHLRPRLREPGPARLRRPDLRRHRPDRRQGALEHRLPAVRLPGRAVPQRRRRPDPLRRRPRRAWTATSAAAVLDALQEAQRTRTCRSSATRKR